MAAWQFSILVLPRSEILDDEGNIPLKLTEQKISSLKGFLVYQAAVDFVDQKMNRSAKEGKFFWGDAAGFDIKFYFSNDKKTLENILLRFDLNVALAEQIQIALELAKVLDGVLFDEDAMQTILPTEEALRWAIMRSDAAKFVTNPRQYLADVRAKMLDDPEED